MDLAVGFVVGLFIGVASMSLFLVDAYNKGAADGVRAFLRLK